MCDYADLPKLVPVMDRILGYLSVKERVRCKGVCRTWRAEIELRDRKSDNLVLHLGPYRRNMRWTETNNRRLMKFENSFQMKNLTVLGHPLSRSLLKKTKKLAFIDFNTTTLNPTILAIQPYLSYFDQCEEIEIRCSRPESALTFDLPKLKVLVFKDNAIDKMLSSNSPIDKLVLNCPSLEVLFYNRRVNFLHFQNVKKLKRLICFGWPATVLLNGKFSSLVYLNLFAARDEPVNDRLLERMPKLKRLVLYSKNLQADLKIIREQQKRCGLENLEVLFNGFRDPFEIYLDTDDPKFIIADPYVDHLHENYSKLVENLPWSVCVDYSQLFNKFKILPSNFFERFSDVLAIQIFEVANYTHLLGFLKCYPFVERVRIHFSKVDAYRVIDLVHMLQPSLTELSIVEDRPSDLLMIDLSFLLLLNLTQLDLVSTHLPVEFLRRVAAKRGQHLNVFKFGEVESCHKMFIAFLPTGVFLFDSTCQLGTPLCPSVEALIAHMQSDPHLNTFLL